MLSFPWDVSIPEVLLLVKVVDVDVILEFFSSTSTDIQIEQPKFFALIFLILLRKTNFWECY